MKIQQFMIGKQEVSSLSERATIGEALAFLDETGYRRVPVIESVSNRFLGNVEKIDIFEYSGDKKDNVLNIIKEEDGYVRGDDSFKKIFNRIKWLPYLAIVDEQGKFDGILTHAQIMDLLEDTYSDGISLTIGLFEQNHAIERISAIVGKHTSILSMFTLGSNRAVRQIHLSIPKDTPTETVNQILDELNNTGVRVTNIE
ncbi:CBS domain-containing protein [Bacillus sp. FJAT-27445]|uniref:CBS domain-containing protein n=1 Tax=Bacillus sp. FJAT-27445 TaxID=1679166 RepID=UPI00074353F8|nr:CBS domain-containing protein [Bacillus sp. FJAT-27445]